MAGEPSSITLALQRAAKLGTVVPPDPLAGTCACCLSLKRVLCAAILSCRFLGTEPEAVLRGNVEEFVAYGFHCKARRFDLFSRLPEAVPGWPLSSPCVLQGCSRLSTRMFARQPWYQAVCQAALVGCLVAGRSEPLLRRCAAAAPAVQSASCRASCAKRLTAGQLRLARSCLPVALPCSCRTNCQKPSERRWSSLWTTWRGPGACASRLATTHTCASWPTCGNRCGEPCCCVDVRGLQSVGMPRLCITGYNPQPLQCPAALLHF